MSKKSPLVSVILPTYNGRKDWITESINSVLNQTFKDFELIIINDCSTNDIENTILELKQKDSRIIYVKNEKNLNQTRSMNKGIDYSKWKYIARIDDDDIRSDKDKLRKQFDFLENNEDYWFCWTDAEIVNEEWNFLYKLNKPYSDKDLRDNLIVWNRFVQSSIFIRKETLDKVWKYDPKWNLVEDYEMRLRLWTVSKMCNLNNSFIKYRVNQNSVTIRNYKKQKWMTIKLILKYYKYYPKKHLIKSIFFHLWEFIVPEKVTKFILKRIRGTKN